MRRWLVLGSSNLRHYLLSEAPVMEGKFDLSTLPMARTNPAFMRAAPDSMVLRALGPKLDPVKNAETELVAGCFDR